MIKKMNPKKIGINTSPLWDYGDHLTAGLKDKLVGALGPEYAKRLVSADRLQVRRRTSEDALVDQVGILETGSILASTSIV